jgi:hypothetical protein
MEFQTHKITLPIDDYDEDDALDERIAKVERRKRKHINRGEFFGV